MRLILAEVQIIPRQPHKRKRSSHKNPSERRILTPGPVQPIASSPAPSTVDKFQKLFPSSPVNVPEPATVTDEPSPPKETIEIRDTPRAGSTPEDPSIDGNFPLIGVL
jgi:hypothetical protein